MCSFTVVLQIKFRLICFKDWVQKLFNCKNWKIVKIIISTTIALLFLFYLWIFIYQMQHPNHTSLLILTYISIRHRRFFDIIESMCNFTFELQMKFLLIYFRDWVQKLFNCKNWKIVFEIAKLDNNRIVFFILSMRSLLIK